MKLPPLPGVAQRARPHPTPRWRTVSGPPPISIIHWRWGTDLAVIRKCLKSGLGHSVHRKRQGKIFNVERVGRLWVLASSAGEE
jgi:hypothetical protein